MEVIKTTNNLEFDLTYGDGEKKHISEGVLLEVNGNEMIFHWGSNRPEVLCASIECLIEAACAMGLGGYLQEYLGRKDTE